MSQKPDHSIGRTIPTNGSQEAAFRRCLAALCAALALLSNAAAAQEASDDDLLARGQYVLQISGCIHCHTAEDGEQLAGGRALETPFGIFYSPNISSHRAAGIGAWSVGDLRRALHQGISPDGDDYYPAFPYTSYTRLGTEDIEALHAYILSLPAIDQANREHDLDWFLLSRFAATAWKWLFFDAAEFQPIQAKGAQWNRGAYIAEAMAHCQECHTPRNLFGALRADRAYAGNAAGPEGDLVPNITSHDSGIGDWSRDALEEFLKFGELPGGDYTTGSMEPVIGGLRHLTPEDREALIQYLRALPPIDNRVRK